MEKLYSVQSPRGSLPFVRATYANPTNYVGEDEAGVKHKGDRMPLLFSLAIHDPLAEAQRDSWATGTPLRLSGRRVRHF